MRVQFKFITLMLVAIGVSLIIVTHISAQADNGLWTTPVNISRSGAASRPVIAVDGSGTLHAVWWDATIGELYARTTTTTTLTWSQPLSLPDVFGRREIDPTTNRTTIAPPRTARLVANGNAVHLFWLDNDLQLLSARNTGGAWGGTTSLAEAAAMFDAAADGTGGLHLAYLRPIDSVCVPRGYLLSICYADRLGHIITGYQLGLLPRRNAGHRAYQCCQ